MFKKFRNWFTPDRAKSGTAYLGFATGCFSLVGALFGCILTIDKFKHRKHN